MTDSEWSRRQRDLHAAIPLCHHDRQKLIAFVERTRSAAAVGERLRDAINEYDYLRRECPDEATRDTGWQAVLSVFPHREGETA